MLPHRLYVYQFTILLVTDSLLGILSEYIICHSGRTIISMASWNVRHNLDRKHSWFVLLVV